MPFFKNYLIVSIENRVIKLMKMFLKNNYLLIISFLILLSLLIMGYNKYVATKEDYVTYMQNYVDENCQNEEDFSKPLCYEFKDGVSADDYFYAFSEVMDNSFFSITLELSVFIVIPSLYFICKYLHSKVIKNDLTRMSYKKIKFKLFKEAYKSALLLPIITIIAIILCYICTGSFTSDINSAAWSAETLSKPFLFLTVYVLNMLFHSIIYVNICLCVARKNHNYFIALILSYLAIFGLEVFLEIFLGGIIFSVLLKTRNTSLFSIINMITFNDTSGMFSVIGFSFMLALITTILVILLYKNKEKLVIDCETN